MTVYKNNQAEKQYKKTAKKAVTNPIGKKAMAKRKTKLTAMEAFERSYAKHEQLYKLLAE